MGKFEKGQWVRRVSGTSLTTSAGRHGKGFVGQIEDIVIQTYGADLVFTNGHRGIAQCYESWHPKVGDRVRFTDTTPSHWFFGPTKDQKEGFVSAVGDGPKSYIVEMGEDTGYVDIEHIEPSTDVTESKAAEAATLLLDVGKTYLTRAGSPVTIVQAYDGDSYDFVGEIDGVVGNKVYKKDGKHGSKYIGNVPDYDLIAELPAPATFTIEAGKFYKTRDGRKVGPAEDNHDDEYAWVVNGLSYDKDGLWLTGSQDPDDLIAEWVDEPAAQAAKASNDNAEPAKPKFKVGDRVRALVSWGEIEQGKIYTVPYLDEDGEVWFTPNGDGGWSDYLTDNELELVTSTPAIVALIEDGTAKPATRPKVHADQASATTEAERLALAYPGQQFGVFILADSKVADLVNVPTAVLRAA